MKGGWDCDFQKLEHFYQISQFGFMDEEAREAKSTDVFTFCHDICKKSPILHEIKKRTWADKAWGFR